MADPIVEEELELLARVTSALEESGEPVEPNEAAIVADLERLREQMLSGSDAKDSASIVEQWHHRSALLAQLRSSRGAPRVDHTSPYFGHLRLQEDGRNRDLCIGRATWIDGAVRIIDWRNAPISKIFYSYQQGDEYEELLAERIHSGSVISRRSVNIRSNQLERVEAPEGTFSTNQEGQWLRVEREQPRLAGGEASALRVHETPEDGPSRRLGGEQHVGRADRRLPEIVGLLDPEQFELITRPSAGFVAIRGTAGSGKTTVALHRIAYLAFDDPRIDSHHTLVAVFSPALRSYVSHVLPSLGLGKVQISTFHEWAREQRQRHYPQLPRDQREDAPALVQQMKLHPMIDAALGEQVRRVSGPATAEQALDDWASVLSNADLLEELDARETSAEAFTSEQIRRFADHNRRCNEELFARMEGDLESRPELDPEDDALLLRAWQRRVGPLRQARRRPLRYRHIAIDEVQDFSPLEVQVLLGCLDRNRSITLAGDTQQHIIEHSGFTSWSEFLRRLGVPGTAIETLRISYRSTAPIVEFALSVLGDLREDEEPPVATRSGPPVELFRFSDRGACVAFLADALRDLGRAEPLASVAILTPSPDASRLYFEGLARGDVPQVRQVTNQDFTFAPGIEVTEIEQVKGLEFDYVILVDASDQNYPDGPAARRLLHVGATRAIHQLWLTAVGTPSALVGAASQAA